MKQKGFIATSLIYSFFLVFIAIMAALLNNFIASNTIMERFNDDVEDFLNDKTYTVTIKSVNSNIQEGYTMTNLVSDPLFDTFTTAPYWIQTKANYSPDTTGGKKGIKRASLGEESYIYQNINLLEGNDYYISLSYIQNFGYPTLKSYLKNESTSMETSQKLSWTKSSILYTSTLSESVPFVIGKTSNSYSGFVYFAEPLVVNLTATFGENKIPTKEWLDNNIDFFQETKSFRKITKVNNGDDVEVKFVPYKNYNTPNVTCPNDVDIEMSSADGYGILKIKSVKKNIDCSVDWSKQYE